MRMLKPFQNLDLAVEVVLEFLVELREIDRLDCNESSGSLPIQRLASDLMQILLQRMSR